MAAEGKITGFTAPCGHPGEPIIGTYVRCSKGCDGKVQTNPRKTPGHVDMCACKPCQIRRKVATIVLRTDKGDTITVPWSGSEERVTGNMPRAGHLRHWKFLDVAGNEYISGTCNYELWQGEFILQLDLFMDANVKLTAWSPVKIWHDAYRWWAHDAKVYMVEL